MRIVSAIEAPLPDEHVIAVDPGFSPTTDGHWRRRINPFAGRSLSPQALTAEQQAASGIQRLRGQGVTAGIISGLDVQIEPGAIGAGADNAIIQLLPGSGLTSTGEDIVISTPRRIALGSLPVHARVDHLDAIASGAPAGGADDGDPPGAGAMRPLLPRRTGPALGSVIGEAAAADLPRIAILVAEPVTATIEARQRDTCPPDPRDDPFDDLQLIDGARLSLYFWPAEQVANGRPDYSLPSPGPDLRNRIAYRIFAVERLNQPSDTHPWERAGLPIALVGFSDDWTLSFIDRASVVRMGGQPNPRTQLVASSGSPLLWQARVAQFVEHLAELGSLDEAALTAAFRQLPPVGFLPSDVIDLQTRRQGFFPAGFRLMATPIPLEHLDVAVRESASLAPYNLDVPDAVELLVPVPERVYEPGLLETAVVDPAFARAMALYVADRTNWLVRREMVRRRRDLLIDSTTGKRPRYPASEVAPDEANPYPQERAPVFASRVRRIEAGARLRTLEMVGGGSSLDIFKGDRVSLWVRIVDATNLQGFSLRFAVNSSAAATSFEYGVFWGDARQLLIARGDPGIALRNQGNVPTVGQWTRLEVPANAMWKAGGGTLESLSLDGLELSQSGGTIEWGPLGTISVDSTETIWIADDAPPGATLRDSGAQNPGWPQAQAGRGEPPVEIEAGTVESGGVRSALSLQRFRDRWTQGFLAEDFADLEEGGIDGFIAAVETRLKATNDAIDLGFVRARSDIYRVRQYMLGADAASRLVTSPALADLALRDEGARAKSLDLADFLKSAYKNDFARDESNPLEPKPKRAATAPLPPPPPPPPPPPAAASATFFNSFSISRFTSVAATSGITSTASSVAAAASATPLVFAPQPVVIATPVGIGGAFNAPVATIAGLQTTTALTSSFSLAGATFGQSFRDFAGIDVQAQLPLPGVVERSLSVAERLKPSPAVEAHGYAIAGKYSVVNALAGLLGNTRSGERPRGIALGDLPAPGFSYNKTADPPAPRRKNTIGDVIFDRSNNGNAREYDDLDERKAEEQRHEADYFTAAVNAIDNSIALMRLVEGRVDLYNKLIADARNVRVELSDDIARLDARLRTIGVELEEARHDVSVASALLAEERDRVVALNAKRETILNQNVNAIIFRRPRQAIRTRAVPVAPATAALAEAPVAVCMREHVEVPEELREYVALFREAAISWFPAVKARLDLIDRLEAARSTLIATRLRAANPIQIFPSREDHSPKLMKRVLGAITAQRAVHDDRRLNALQIDVAGAALAELSVARIALAERASLSDLIAGHHNRAALSRLAAAEVEGLTNVAGCLHASFGETPPAVRLEWAEMLSEFDQPAPLSQLAGLPRWSGLPLDLRRQQQGFIDWLFSKIDRTIPAAEAAMNELVRICILLAAHAPVERIIPARLVAPAPARVGARLDLAVDIRIARVGMTALVRGVDNLPVAHAIVDDLAEGVARARIVKIFGTQATIAANVRINLSDARMH